MARDPNASSAPLEVVKVPFGTITRLVGNRDSAVLKQLPATVSPEPEPACASCPAKDWYLTVKGLQCFCGEKNVVTWVSDSDPVLACDARERLIMEGFDSDSDTSEPAKQAST